MLVQQIKEPLFMYDIHISNVDAKLAKYYMMHDLTLSSVIRNVHLLFLSDTCNATNTAVVSH